MLRVEASNLPQPRGNPRGRRLLPNPPLPRRGQTASRHEILPPSDGASTPGAATAAVRSERWSVRLELADDEIAKLYGQGMTRGAVVWKKGMVEWRPLLITPELSGLLHRTRVSSTELPPPPAIPAPRDLASAADELTLPRPARLPSAVVDEESLKKPTIVTIAPLAMDVEASPKRGRSVEFAAVAVAAFALAWIGHAKLHQQPSITVAPTPAAVVAAAPACEPTPAVTASTASTIPIVAVGDLPLAGAANATGAVPHVGGGRGVAHSASSSGGGPSRSELVAALTQVARAASGCGERGGPVRVVMSFANSGVARSIQVSGADLPAATRSCMIGAASRARVPAFTGDPVTVAKTL